MLRCSYTFAVETYGWVSAVAPSALVGTFSPAAPLQSDVPCPQPVGSLLCAHSCAAARTRVWDPTAGGLWRPAPLQAIGSQSQPFSSSVVVENVQMNGCGCVPVKLFVGTANFVSLIFTRHENSVLLLIIFN